MAKKMGFCIRNITPGCGVYYSISFVVDKTDEDEDY